MAWSEINESEVVIPAGEVELYGNLNIPEEAQAIILFAHGSGSSRFSPRNRFVAKELNNSGFATLLFDLLTEEEERVDQLTVALRFDINLLADRLIKATNWVKQQPETGDFDLGYFGASTGAAAALIAAASYSDTEYFTGEIFAVVSRGGRPDLAGNALSRVLSPTLLIVGGNDYRVIELNQAALDNLNSTSEKQLVIVPGATHLFEEPGALEKVATLARDWFLDHLEFSERRTA
jgi:putative phosphoribosyl transferase